MWPTWERCEHCHAQLYIAAAAVAGEAGFWRPRFAPQQRHCLDAPDPSRPGHRQDLAWARRFLGPHCAGRVALDGPDRAGIECPHRPRRQVAWTIPRRTGGSPWTQQLPGCHEHFPALVEQAERAVAAARLRRPDWPAPTVTELALVVSTRDRAHGRPGHWTETPAEVVQYQLF